MIILSIAIVVLALAAFVAWDLWRSKRKRKAPKADLWFWRIGLSTEHAALLSEGDRVEAVMMAQDIEDFSKRHLDPVVLVLRSDPIPLPGGGTADGVYHSVKKGWDHAWIELYSLDALEHELLHHATGLEDTPEFRELFNRYKESRKA